MKIIKKYIVYCVSKDSYWGKYLILYSVGLALRPLLNFLTITNNPNADKQGRIYYLIPYVVAFLAYLIQAYLIEDGRPYLQCLAEYFHTENGLPCPEIVLTAAYSWVDIMYGGSYKYIAMNILIISSLPILSYMTYTAYFYQSLFSITFSLLAILMFIGIRYAKEYIVSEEITFGC